MPANSSTRKPITVLIDADLEHSLLAERDRLSLETGLRVSMTQVASRAMRVGLPSRNAR